MSISRRIFLKGAAALPALTALPAVASPKPVFVSTSDKTLMAAIDYAIF